MSKDKQYSKKNIGSDLMAQKSKELMLFQVFVIVLAFGLMTLASYFFIIRRESDHLNARVEYTFDTIESRINSDLKELRTMLGIMSETSRGMLINGASLEEMKEYLNRITDYAHGETLPRAMGYEYVSARVINKPLGDIPVHGFISAHAMFDIFDGAGYNALGWEGEPGYDPTGRDWYKAAVAANGEIAVTDPYIDVETGIVTISYARCIFDDDGERIATICIDVLLNRIFAISQEYSANDASYWMLIDRNLNFICHPNDDFLGRNLSDTNLYTAELANDIYQYGHVQEHRIVNNSGADSIVSVRKMSGNGWYLGVMTEMSSYYSYVKTIQSYLAALAIVFSTGLSAVLLSVITQKNKTEQQVQLIFDAMPNCANLWNENGNNILTNEKTVSFFGLSSKQEYLDRFYELSPERQPDGSVSADKAREYVKLAFDTGQVIFEWMHCNLDGELIPTEVTLTRINQGNDYVVAGYTRDLRNEIAMINKLRESEERLQILLDSAPLCMNIIDKNLKCTMVNKEALRMFKLKNKQEYMDRFAELSPPKQPDGSDSETMGIQHLMTAFEKGLHKTEWMHQTIDGEPLPVELILVRIKHQNDYLVAGYTRDLRESKAKERAEQSSRYKSTFLANMSHEIRTPMNTILGIAEIQLQKEGHPPETKEAFNQISDAGDLLLNIINDVLDISKIEAGKLEIIPIKYDVPSLINDSSMLNHMRYENKPISFLIDVDPDTPLTLIGDDFRIKQILNNLLSNAFKYTDEGKVVLSVSARPNEEDKTTADLTLRVEDTGQGMTKEQIDKMFDEFTRFNPEMNRTVVGSGLGMSISRRLVELMHGKIVVESNPGIGSVFTVIIPQKIACDEKCGIVITEKLRKLEYKSHSRIKKSQLKREPMPYGCVLVVDDVSSNLQVARGMLILYGLTVEFATSGIEAVRMVKSGKIYDIIFMDHMMPGMDGIEATKQIRALGYKEPIVALTANVIAGQSEMFLSNGFDAFISKPIDTRELDTVLNNYIRDKQTQEVIDKARRDGLNAKKRLASKRIAGAVVKDSERAIMQLKQIFENGDISASDLESYTIIVHGMKSALLNINENELSARAGELEKAATEGDMTYIKNVTPDFITSLKALKEKYKGENK